jgi:hypothetical protein
VFVDDYNNRPYNRKRTLHAISLSSIPEFRVDDYIFDLFVHDSEKVESGRLMDDSRTSSGMISGMLAGMSESGTIFRPQILYSSIQKIEYSFTIY